MCQYLGDVTAGEEIRQEKNEGGEGGRVVELRKEKVLEWEKDGDLLKLEDRWLLGLERQEIYV